MTKRQNRMTLVALLVAGVSLAGYLGLQAFNENLLYFFSPTDVVDGKAPKGKSFRLGGLVAKNSVKRDGLKVNFDVTDNANTFSIEYVGILPDLFREEQGIITTGSLVNGTFIATEVLAKHDENYMPPEVADALKKSSNK
ncbi:MAG: cytochrome c maturation protein CcmE [Candidatus Thioglobus sp.]|jgi:cytochrome c-type biogenesis protein CcmE|uniref:cytochrome c maturation protein CcmE n=1 Tax=Candidatus Thioglobus sp. TaxID=2026721 RepID=UPI000A7C6724|nr:cytochrome c maturation protein CcmE [Candidatus Thioglobus sp.]MBT3187103.1 cytochrome c maturation protein CcmE [Candidatus Thioglobus sp.]MBT3431222.1 cytochrome c maturation protein CcmE [Candidatus Thioglobus sp.]MBT3964938.1 cytochrome c maturation protein CcmE [Candidatus Thioglobus sp.]MBT4316549.1 cytochrome c maturation protein CcmE [Candidatus Thioglobus sp.]MBT4553020.1 cytochrome c maturation protein CcmE [Candidatus Thioglobus sp.]